MKHIFLLEDDETLGRGIAIALTGPEASVVCRSTLAQGREALAKERFDLLILDVNLPDGSGLDLLRQLRAGGDCTPAILLTANDLELDEVTGLEAGADDYITKPFSLAVLYAKTMALIRRTAGSSSEVLTCGAVTVHPGPRTCAVSGQPCPLSPRAFDLLLCLMRNRGQVLSREQLLDKVWGLDFEGDSRAVDVQIKTVYKAGYQLKEGAK